MKYRVGSITITIPGADQGPIKSGTPQIHFVDSHWRDIVKECRSLYNILQLVDLSAPLVVEGMAGCGFSAAVMINRYPRASLVLNDYSEECCQVLRLNYPGSAVSCCDVRGWQPPDCDLAFLDFNSFSLLKWRPWGEALLACNRVSRYLLLTDSASFGFRFGNLPRYGVHNPEDYYFRLQEELGLPGKSLRAVSIFGNAALVLFGPIRSGQSVEFVGDSDLTVSRVQGFGL